MADPKGFRLYVNLGASQTLCRSKRSATAYAWASAGRGQAIVIHTATGRHLEELEKVFADAAVRTIDSGHMAERTHSSNRSSTASSDPSKRKQVVAHATELLIGTIEP